MVRIGVDLGGTNIAAGIVDENGKIIKSGSTPTLAQRHYSDVIADMGRLVNPLIEESGIAKSDIESVGIGFTSAGGSTAIRLYPLKIRWLRSHVVLLPHCGSGIFNGLHHLFAPCFP